MIHHATNETDKSIDFKNPKSKNLHILAFPQEKTKHGLGKKKIVLTKFRAKKACFERTVAIPIYQL